MRTREWVVVVGVALSASAPAAAVERFQLANGVRVLLEERHDLPLVFISVVLKGGIAREPHGFEGLANLTARLMARGTKDFTRAQIDERIDELGATFAAQASTEAIWVGGEVLKRNVNDYVALLASVVKTPLFPANELEKTRREILSEIELSREEDQVSAGYFFRKFLYGTHPLGRNTLGLRATVQKITRDQIMAMHAKSIGVEHVIIAVAGDITRASLEPQLTAAFGNLAKGAGWDNTAGAVAQPEGRRVLLVDRPDRTQTQIVVGQISIPASHADYIPLTVANAAFGSGFTSRLMREVRVKRGWSYGARSSISPARGRGPFMIGTFPKNADALATIDLVLKMYDDLAKNGITDEELAFSKGLLVGRHPFTVETARKRLELVVDAELLGLPDDFFFKYPERVRAVTAKQVRDAVTRTLQTRNIAVVMVCTARHFAEKIGGVVGSNQVQIVKHTDDPP